MAVRQCEMKINMLKAIACISIFSAIFLRLLCCFGDLWFDEIWSLRLTESVSNPGDVIGGVTHDNNHPLNTWWMWLVGGQHDPVVYRLPALICGSLAVFLAGSKHWKTHREQALWTWLLLGNSLFLVQYSSEARGYGVEMLSAVVAIQCAEKLLTDSSNKWQAIAFGISCTVGMLAHASFMLAYGGLLVPLLWGQFSPRLFQLRNWWFRVFVFGVPIASATFLYVSHYQHIQIGGGGSNTAWQSLVELGAILAGGAGTQRTAAPLSLLMFGLILWSLWRLAARGELARAGIALSVMLVPILLVLVLGDPPIYPRYFLVPGLVSLQVVAASLSHCSLRPTLMGRGCLLITFAILAANVWQVLGLVWYGRGGYSEAVRLMATESRRNVMTIGSDHDFRNEMLLSYFIPRVNSELKFEYIMSRRQGRASPEWVLLHDIDSSPQFPPEIGDPAGNVYSLRRVFEYRGLSGWHWAAYQLR